MNQTEKLKELSKKYRNSLFKKFIKVKQGHPGSTFSMLDIVVTLFHGGFLEYNDQENKFNDKIIISKGHATVALYPILVDFGVIDSTEWDNWGYEKSQLRVFGNISIPGINATTGSLGHGIGVGSGMALHYKRTGQNKKVYVVISEGELYEGSTWEALLFAAHHKLDNLYVIIDVNSLIILGKTGDCLSLDPIKTKIQNMGFDIFECDGHDHESLKKNFILQENSNLPSCLIANTIKGKGLSIMENKANWHYWNDISEEDIDKCFEELK